MPYIGKTHSHTQKITNDNERITTRKTIWISR